MPKPPAKSPGDEILSSEWNQGWDWMQEGDGAGTNADMVDGKHVVDLWTDIQASTTADWNDQTTPGWNDLLLRGDAPNGPGPAIYYHILVLSYADNLTQVAVPYGASTNIDSGGLWLRGRYAGTWGAWRLYGGRLEYGSNANGEYVRFANGLQICWIYPVYVLNGSYATWTYPAAFAASPTVVVTGYRAQMVLYSDPPGTASVAVYNSSTTARNAGIIAIGRWK